MRLTLTLLLIVSLQRAAFSQQADSVHLSAITSKLNRYSASRPAEKAYLQLNKPGYTPGDTIWFKGYVTIGTHHQPSALSGILYAELINDKDKMVRSLQLKLANGITKGEIALDDKLPPGQYRLRAYTNWMRNAGPDHFFSQTLDIGNIKSNAVYIASSVDASGKNNEGLINTKLTYTDKYGRAYDHKAVSYEVKADTTVIFKGTGITDAKGNITFAFSDKAAAGKKQLNINNHISLVSGVVVDKTVPVNVKDKSIDIQFFPEGGALVNNVRSKVAFKAIGGNGLGAEVKGVIVDNDNNEVAEFSSQHAGMGVFALLPQTGKTYTAKYSAADNASLTAKLPDVKEKGFVLSVNASPSDSSKLNIRIATNAATLADQQGSAFYIVGQMNGAVYYTTAGKLTDFSFAASVAKGRFPTGIAQFTLFSANDEPLDERVAFIKNKSDLLNLDVSSAKRTYGAKEMTGLDLGAKSNSGRPVQGSFSLAVYNEDKANANDDNESTILSNLLLTSDLKGYIEEPNYYFNEDNDPAQTKADLDVLMLTQGYRRFDWREVIGGKYQQLAYQPETGLNISGQLTSASGKPIANGKLKVLALSQKAVIDTVSDANGNFMLKDVDFPDSTKLVIEARKANDGKNVNIALDNSRTIPLIYKSNIADASLNSLSPFMRMMSAHTDNETFAAAPDTNQLAANVKANTTYTGKELKEVNIKSKNILPPDRFNGFGTYEQYPLDMAVARNYNFLSDAVKYKIPGMEKTGTPMPPIVLNGSDHSNLRLGQLDPNDIESVTAVYAPTSFVPVRIIVTTKSFAGTDTLKLKPNTNAVAANGKTLKEVNIKEHIPDKPDQTNLWGAVRPDVIVTGDQLQDYNDIVHGLLTKAPALYYKDGKLYDPVALKETLFTKPIKPTPPPRPIPVVIDGIPMQWNENIDDKLNIDQIEDIKVVQSIAIKELYGFPMHTDDGKRETNDKVIIITTKQYAGTVNANEKADTIRSGANTNVAKTGKTLKDVNIKDRVADKPGKTNLFGTHPPEQIISGDKMREVAMARTGIEANVFGLKYDQFGKIYDMDPTVKGATPIPIIVDGRILPVREKDFDLDQFVQVDNIEDVRVLKGDQFKTMYGIPISDPNKRFILITTKLFAGTEVEKADTLRKVTLNQTNIKTRKNAGTELAPWAVTVTHSANLNGPGRADQVFTAKDLQTCPEFLSCLLNKMPGIITKTAPDGTTIYYFARHAVQSITANPPIKFMLEGVFVNADDLNSINVNDVETVEILNSNSYLAVYGTTAPGGLIIVTTRRGVVEDNDAIAYKSVPGVIYTKFNGYYKARDFYTPKYTVTNTTKPDNRTAVYWNPDIITGADGKFKMEYFNSDVKGVYKAVVEGIDNDGNIGRYVYRYKVE